MSQLLNRMYEHVHWANTEMLGLLKGLQPVPARSLQLFAHILAAEQIWLVRLNGEDSTKMNVWPELDLAACEQMISANKQGYDAYLRALSDTDLTRIIAYKRGKGTTETAISDILIHVANHGSYHRGQITASLAAAGLPIVNTDFIQFVRQIK
mgnify:CR=1 FL=1